MATQSEFDRVWPLLLASIETDIGGAAYTKEEVWSEIDKGDAHLWTASQSACIVEVVDRPDYRCCHIFVAGGKLREIMTVLWPQVEQWARDNGCHQITASGRSVWERVVKKHGFKPVLTTFAKEL